MPTSAPQRRRSTVKPPALDLPAFTPSFERTLCQAAGLPEGSRGLRRALVDAVRAELSAYRASAKRDGGRPVASQRAAISELMRAAEALLRALGDVDPHTAAVLTEGPAGVDTTAWAGDLHRLWDRLVLLDRRFEAQEVPRRELDRVTLARLIDIYRSRGGNGDLLTFLRHTCGCVSLRLPTTDEKLIAIISQLPTLA
jgi:hypothetical protein